MVEETNTWVLCAIGGGSSQDDIPGRVFAFITVRQFKETRDL